MYKGRWIRSVTNELVSIIVALFLLTVIPGCGSQGGRANSPPPNPVGDSSSAGVSTASDSVPPSARPLFYDFPDIPIPQELDLQADDSYVVQTGQVKTGLLTLRGRVDLTSVINFFQLAMTRENWKPRGDFRYRRSILIFEKPDKICVIRLYEGTIYTYVEIFVAPSRS